MTSIRVGSKFISYVKKYPIIRGMISYGTLWPTSCYLQQRIQGIEEINWRKCVRYSIYGTLVCGPAMYFWVRLTTFFWPQSTLKIAALKAFAEQVIYEPIFLVAFFMTMCIWEGKTYEEAAHETHVKFMPTFMVSCCVWPVCQTLNFAYVPERNRVVVTSLVSLGWVTFLAQMKQMRLKREQEEGKLNSSDGKK